MNVSNVADLNHAISEGRFYELILVQEALQEERIARIAEMIAEQKKRVILIAGPSSSGKTTFSHRLAIQLRVRGLTPHPIPVDNYFVDREDTPKDANGNYNFECLEAVDLKRFNSDMKALLENGEAELPIFNFITGKREWKGHKMHLSENTVIIVEGLHALNPALLPDGIEESLVFRLYVSPLLPLNLDDHNRIPSSTLRLLRRIVRDYATRGSTVEQTMSMWDSVRAGEIRWIYPYQENADMIFNSSTLYELPVLKRHIFPLLKEISPEQPCYEQVRSIVKILNYVLEADVDDEIPPTSLVREFIGGNSFYR
jgi:uridine kinase